jgi:hypothetical protein
VQLAVAESTNEDLEAMLAEYKNVGAEVSELRDENELLVAVNREQKEKLEILQVSINARHKPDTGKKVAAETYRRLCFCGKCGRLVHSEHRGYVHGPPSLPWNACATIA